MPVHRMVALTDGVAAIALTLLVLDVKLPPGLSGGELDRALAQARSQVWTFLLSAVVITLFWRAHHDALRAVERADAGLFWLNVAFLALLSLIPFPTSVLQEYGDRPLGPGLYGAVVGTAALVVYAIGWYANRRAEPAQRTRLGFPAQALVFLASVGIAPLSPAAAEISWVAAVPLSVLSARLAAARP